MESEFVIGANTTFKINFKLILFCIKYFPIDCMGHVLWSCACKIMEVAFNCYWVDLITPIKSVSYVLSIRLNITSVI